MLDPGIGVGGEVAVRIIGAGNQRLRPDDRPLVLELAPVVDIGAGNAAGGIDRAGEEGPAQQGRDHYELRLHDRLTAWLVASEPEAPT